MLESSSPAVLEYEMSDFSVLHPGSYVLCAVSGAQIPLDRLTYWSARYQEAYRGADEATAALMAGGAANLLKG
jgi:hypothetical protein